MISEKLTNDQINYCINQLMDHQLFSGLSNEELKQICKEMVWMEGHQN